jgi:hypothetical protein
MHIEKRNQKMATTIGIVLLVSVVLIILVGLLMQGQSMPSKDRDMGRQTASLNFNFESAQTGPTGKLVISTGIVLLVVALGVLVVMLWVGRSRVVHDSA